MKLGISKLMFEELIFLNSKTMAAKLFIYFPCQRKII